MLWGPDSKPSEDFGKTPLGSSGLWRRAMVLKFVGFILVIVLVSVSI